MKQLIYIFPLCAALCSSRAVAGHHQLQKSWAEKFFFEQHLFQENETVLDIGCGDGELTHKIAMCTQGKVVGVDAAPSSVAYALANYGSEHLQFKEGTCSDDKLFKKMSNSCDVVVSFHALHYAKNHGQVLRNIRKALKPGGVAYLRFAAQGENPLYDVAQMIAHSSDWEKYFVDFEDPTSRYSKKEYQHIIAGSGLKVIDLKVAHTRDTLESKEALFDYAATVIPHVAHLGQDLGSEYLTQVVETYLMRRPYDPSGAITITDSYLEVVLKK